jgi:hypothetical protein
VYDPATNIWSLTTSFNIIRGDNQAILLPSGQVLAEGAGRTAGRWVKFAELYDPASGTWSFTGDPVGGDGRLTMLLNGMVLGEGAQEFLKPRDEAQLYDPATGTWSVTRSLQSHRGGHTATLLPDGEVLVAGGFGSDD